MVRVVQKMLGLNVKNRNDADEVGRSIASLPHVDAWEAAVVEYFSEREIRGRQRQTLHASTKQKFVKLSMEPLIENIRLLLEHRADNEVISRKLGELTHSVAIPVIS